MCPAAAAEEKEKQAVAEIAGRKCMIMSVCFLSHSLNCKAALIDIFVVRVNQMTTCDLKDVTQTAFRLCSSPQLCGAF